MKSGDILKLIIYNIEYADVYVAINKGYIWKP